MTECSPAQLHFGFSSLSSGGGGAIERNAHASSSHLRLPFFCFRSAGGSRREGDFEQLIVFFVFFLEQEDKINQITVINCHLSSCCAALEGVISRGRVTADVSVIFITVSVVSHSRRLRLWSCGLIVSTYLCVCACVCVFGICDRAELR